VDQRKCEHMNERVLDSNEHHPEQHISVHVTWRWWIQYVRTFFWRFTGWNDVIYICKIRVAHVYNHNVVLLPALPSCFAISFPGATHYVGDGPGESSLWTKKYFLNYLQWTNVLTIVVKQQVEKQIPLYHHRLVENLFARTIRNFCRLPGTKTFLGNIHRVIKDFSK